MKQNMMLVARDQWLAAWGDRTCTLLDFCTVRTEKCRYTEGPLVICLQPLAFGLWPSATERS